MAETGVVFFSVFICIFFTSQIPLIESTSGDVTLNMSNFRCGKDQYRYRLSNNSHFTVASNSILAFRPFTLHYIHQQTQPLACEFAFSFNNWKDINKRTVVSKIKVFPYTNVTLEIRDKATGRIRGSDSTVTLAKEPEALVTELECDSQECRATIEDDCRKYNGYDMAVQFTLKPSSEELKNSLVTERAGVNSEGEAKITLRDLDLLPFTNYTVTAILANNAGVATDSSLTREVSFTTNPERPGRVSSLAVTHSTPYSLHVEWSPPADDLSKGKLSKYELQWNIHTQSSNEKTVHVKANVKQFTITGLEPNTPYDIQIRAENTNTNGFGDPVCITNTTMKDSSDPRTGRETSDAKTSLSFSWKDLPHEYDEAEYYTVTFSGGGNNTVTNTIATEVKFDRLTPGKKYTLEVKGCFKKGSCRTVKTLLNWTRPEEPRLIEKINLQRATSTTLTIQLPVLENPPGKHWVVLKKYSGDGDDEKIKHNELEKTRQKALDKVRRKSEEEKNGKKSNGKQANGRNRRSATPGQNDDQLRIVAEIEVERKELHETVEVGGDWNEGKGLEGDSEYVVFIVTETRAGPYSEYKVCEPRIMRTTKLDKEPSILGMMAGTCAGAVFLICLFTTLVVKYKRPKKEPTVDKEDDTRSC